MMQYLEINVSTIPFEKALTGQELNSAGSTRPKIVVADDHHLVLDAISYMAASEFDVQAVDSLRALEDTVDKFNPELVILDIRMPDGDGIEAGRRILQRRSGLKLMFLSMHAEPRFVKRAFDAGALGYISKRAPAEEVMQAIRTVLSGTRFVGSQLEFSEHDGLGSDEELTERQKEVLRLIAQGCSAKEIANQLNISVRTAEFHRAAIMERLKLHSTAMMTRYAVERGLA
ncbi:MAG: response regulator transcription factor [Acidobacteriaceae bacterium]|nr:response regulator transcription factor [Acidobacteriaceae bacterium]